MSPEASARTLRARLLRAGAVVCLLSVAGAERSLGQERALPLRPAPAENRSVVPFMEGWYANDDGSVTISFGYWNLNRDSVVELPLGETNFIEPVELDGMQPTVFLPGRQHGVFGVTVPAELKDTDVWWTLVNGNGETTRVPGRAASTAYQLDRTPRPHGSLPPLIWFEDGGPVASGPEGFVAEETLTARVGEPLLLEAHVRDPSEREADDPRVGSGVAVHTVWYRHQGPGSVTFTRHESMPAEEPAGEGAGGLAGVVRPPPGPEQATLPDGAGTVRVYATFEVPGDYLMRVQADNWGAPDSSEMDQCCWSNAFVRVRVEE